MNATPVVAKESPETTMSDTEPPAITLGACRGGPTLVLCLVDGELLEECVRCEMLVNADQADDWVFGFKARCRSKSDD